MRHYRIPVAIAVGVATALAAGATGVAKTTPAAATKSSAAKGAAALMAEHRGGTLKLLAKAAGGTLDPQINYTLQYWQLYRATQDGLVAFKAAGGDEAFKIVPDLADDRPQADRRRQDLDVHAAQGHQVLQRQAGHGTRRRCGRCSGSSR